MSNDHSQSFDVGSRFAVVLDPSSGMAFLKKYYGADRFSKVEEVIQMRVSLFMCFNQPLGNGL